MPGQTTSQGWSWDSNPKALSIVAWHFFSLETSILKSCREKGGDVSASRQKELVPIILIIKTLASVVKYTIS